MRCFKSDITDRTTTLPGTTKKNFVPIPCNCSVANAHLSLNYSWLKSYQNKLILETKQLKETDNGKDIYLGGEKRQNYLVVKERYWHQKRFIKVLKSKQAL